MRLFIGMLLGLTLSASVCANEGSEVTTRNFRLDGFPFSQTEKALRPMLSDSATIEYDDATDAVSITDRRASLIEAEKRYKQYLFDQPNVKVTVSTKTASKKNDQHLGFGTSTGGNNTSTSGRSVTRTRNGVRINPAPQINAMKRSGTGISAGANSQTTSGGSSTFIVTKSGYPARLWSGTQSVKLISVKPCVSDAQWAYINNHLAVTGGPQTMTVIENSGVSLQVRPTVLDNGLVEVSVFPEISYPVQGGKTALRVTSLATTVMMKPGTQMEIAGIVNQNKERYVSLFGPTLFSQKSFQDVMNMTLSVEIVKSQTIKK